MSDLKDLEHRAHRANTIRRGLAGAGSGAVAGGLSAAALRAAGVHTSPGFLAAGGAAAGGLAGLAHGRAENLKDELREQRTDDRHARRLLLREMMKSAFAEELAYILVGGP